jgi:ferredoxin-NADP reductase
MEVDAAARSMLVREIRWEARDVVSLTLEDPAGQLLPAWTAGAHIDFHVKDVASREHRRRSRCPWRVRTDLLPGRGLRISARLA